jgi:hypothetical protein
LSIGLGAATGTGGALLNESYDLTPLPGSDHTFDVSNIATGALLGGAGGATGYYAEGPLNSLARRVSGTAPARPAWAETPDVVLSGHGSAGPGELVMPDGTYLNFYAPHGASISDPLGNAIELEHGQWASTHMETYWPGDVVPDVLHPPFDPDLKTVGNPTVVDVATPLSGLLGPQMGRVDWAACRFEKAHPNSQSMYDIGKVLKVP